MDIPSEYSDAADRDRRDEYLATFRRIPDEAVLAMAGKHFNMGDPYQCVCGWAFRVALAAEIPVAVTMTDEKHKWLSSAELCQHVYGGSSGEWHEIYFGVVDADVMPLVEQAFIMRLQEATCRMHVHAPTLKGWCDSESEGAAPEVESVPWLRTHGRAHYAAAALRASNRPRPEATTDDLG